MLANFGIIAIKMRASTPDNLIIAWVKMRVQKLYFQSSNFCTVKIDDAIIRSNFCTLKNDSAKVIFPIM